MFLSPIFILRYIRQYVNNILRFYRHFIDFFLVFGDNQGMEGLTIPEMAEILGIKRRAVETRLVRAGLKPITKDAVYDKSVLDVIKNTPGKGRPRKNKKPE
jgi:hypothetical protein